MVKFFPSTDFKDADKLLVAVDCVIFGFDGNQLKLMLLKRPRISKKIAWSIIGGFVAKDESVSTAAERILHEFTGLQNIYLKELGCYGETNRDSSDRVISIVHYALIRHTVSHTQEVKWFNLKDVPKLILDHGHMVENALHQITQNAKYQPIGFELLPEKFTIRQLKTLYESLYQRPLDKRNFSKKILKMDILEKLDEKDMSGSKKGAFLYRFDKAKYKKLMAKGFIFEV